MAAADYADDNKKTPPPELRDWLRSKQFDCLPRAGGWKDQSYRYVNRGLIYYNVYSAITNYRAALKDSKRLKQWIKDNRDIMDTVKRVEEMRRDINRTDSN